LLFGMVNRHATDDGHHEVVWNFYRLVVDREVSVARRLVLRYHPDRPKRRSQ